MRASVPRYFLAADGLALPAEHVRVVVAGTGSAGGIGRYEALLVRGLEEIARTQRLDVRYVWRRRHPDYLGIAASRGEPEEISPARFTARLLRELVRFRPDVVVFTLHNLAQASLALPLLRPSVRIVVCTHGDEVWIPLPRLKRTALRRARRVVANASFNVERLVDVQGLARDAIDVVHLALEPSWERVAARAEPDPRRPLRRLLTVARLDAHQGYKGADAVIEALPELARRFPDVEYLVIGGGTDVGRHEQLARDLGVAERVTFAGVVDDDELLRAYEACDVFVLPSTGEGFGLVLLEAMAYAKPVVAAATGGPLDIVEDGRTGRLVAAQADVGGALLDLMSDPDAARAMGRAGRDLLREKFSFGRYVESWREVLRRATA